MRTLILFIILFYLIAYAYAENLPSLGGLDRAFSIQENDATPQVWDCRRLVVTNNGILIDNGDGIVSLDTASLVSRDGSTALLGNWNVGAFNITSDGTIQGDIITADTLYLREVLFPTDAVADNDVIKYDSALGRLNFEADAGGAGSPGGSDTHVQYNDGGAFGGEAPFTYNKTINRLTVDSAIFNWLTVDSSVTFTSPLSIGSGGTGSTVGYTVVSNDVGTLKTQITNRVSTDAALTALSLDGVAFPDGTPTDNFIIKYDSALGRWAYEADATGGASGKGAIHLTFVNPLTNDSVWVRMPYSMTVTSWDVTAPFNSTISFDVLKSPSWMPVRANSVGGTFHPYMKTDTQSQDTVLSGWNTTFTQYDYVVISVDSVSADAGSAANPKFYLTIIGDKT